MKKYEVYIANVLSILRDGRWPNGVPTVRAKVRLAVNSLLAQDRNLFNKEVDYITDVIRRRSNRGIRKILNDTPEDAFALAIREALD